MNPLRGYILSLVLKKAEKVCKNFSGRVLDLGCGKGGLLKNLSSNPGLKVFGLDISEGQLFYAKDSGVPLVQGNIFFLPFKDSSIENVLCFNTIYNFNSLDEFRQGFIEMARVIVSGGRIVIDIRNRRNPFIRFKYWLYMKRGGIPTISYSPDEMVKVFKGLGCNLQRIEYVGVKIPFLALGYIMVFIKGET